MVGADHAGRLRPRAAGARPGPHHPQPGGGLPALPVPRRGRHQDRHQRPVHLRPRRQPLVGPLPGLRNFYVACGVMAGFSQGGGVGLALGQWISEGEPEMDVFAMGRGALRPVRDARVCARQGRGELSAALLDHLSQRRTAGGAAAEDDAGVRPPACPGRRVRRHLRPRARPLVRARGQRAGGGADLPPLQRACAVGEECRAVRGAAGLLEISNFAKYEVSGAGAGAWLGRILANPRWRGRRPPRPLAHAQPQGKAHRRLHGAKLGPGRYMVVGSGPAEAYHLRWFASNLPAKGVCVESLSASLAASPSPGPPRARCWRASPTRTSRGGVPVPVLARHGHRRLARPGGAHLIQRRARFRALGAGGLPAGAL